MNIPDVTTMQLTYRERAKLTKNIIANKLFNLLDDKKTNLALSADVTTSDELIALAEKLGPEICILKTHIDIISDYTPALTQTLKQLANQQQFLLFEDRKFADIGNTVKLQYEKGIYHIASWADIINAHILPGPGIIRGLAAIGVPKQRALLLLAEMSSADNLFTEEYKQQTLTMAEAFSDFVIGFITQSKLGTDPKWICMTPGVQLSVGNDTLGQRYVTPEQAIIQQQTDIIIVGRGIIAAQDPVAQAQHYRARGWQAYLDRIC